LQKDALAVLREKLLPRATLITPNLPELEFLLGRRITTPQQSREAGRELSVRCDTAVLAKGGHLTGDVAIDFFYDGPVELMLESPRIRGVSTHGTGCTYSAAIAAFCARGLQLPDAVTRAKEFISNAIAHSVKVGKHFVLGIEPPAHFRTRTLANKSRRDILKIARRFNAGTQEV
jgi:hydroxymethylpyrimidine/phosphomethylpyrimidine kinase